jgi:hypothetical protein
MDPTIVHWSLPITFWADTAMLTALVLVLALAGTALKRAHHRRNYRRWLQSDE